MNIYLIFLVPVIVGAVMAFIGLVIRNRPRGKIRNGIFTDALIVDFAVKTAYMKKVPYKAVSPVVEFTAPDGSRIIAVYPYFINQDFVSFRIGDVIKICYDRNNTNRFHIENDGSKSNLSCILIFSGLFIIASDIVMFLKY